MQIVRGPQSGGSRNPGESLGGGEYLPEDDGFNRELRGQELRRVPAGKMFLFLFFFFYKGVI